MADLARLIAKQGSDLRLRQAIVTAAPAGAVCTIRFGDLASTSTADDIPGVRCLASAPIANGDTVWVLQQGGALLVIGKVGDPISAGGGGVTDHGALTGLADDDHSVVYPRFTIGASAPGTPRTGDLWLVIP